MGVRRIEDLVAFQFADEFASAVFALLRASPAAANDFRFASQLNESTTGVASNISEGYHRILPSESAQFLRYALSSLAEAKLRLQHGAKRGLYPTEACALALVWADRCRRVTDAYRQSQLRLAEERRKKKKKRPENPKRRPKKQNPRAQPANRPPADPGGNAPPSDPDEGDMDR